MNGAVRLIIPGYGVGLALALFTVFLPFDMWWAGSLWSRPSVALTGLVVVGWVIWAMLWSSERHSAQKDIGGWTSVRTRRFAAFLPVVFAFWCLCFPSRGALGDAFKADQLRGGVSSQALFSEWYLAAWQMAGRATFIGASMGVRLGLAALGYLWAWGCSRLFVSMLGARRGALLAWGFAFSTGSAQFAGYFERSGLVLAWVPWLVWLAFRRFRRRGDAGGAYGCLTGIFAGLTHGSALCMAPALALAGAGFGHGENGRRWSRKGTRLLYALVLFAAMAGSVIGGGRCVAALATRHGGGGPVVAAGGDTLGTVAFSPMQLDAHHFTHYLAFSRWWWWEHAESLGMLGPGCVAALGAGVTAIARRRRHPSVRRAVGLAGVCGSLGFVGVWGFDWGMLNDWNLAVPWWTAAVFFALGANPGLGRQFSVRGCAWLSAGIAMPGLVFVLHNFAGATEGLPDPRRWEATTGREHTLFLAAVKPSWRWVMLPVWVDSDGRRRVLVSLTPVRRSIGMVDRLEWRAVDGEAVAMTEAEALSGVNRISANEDPAARVDGRWSVAFTPRASGGAVAELFRPESRGVSLEWAVFLPPGRYSPWVRVFESTWFPVGYVPLLRWDVRVED